MEQHFINKDSSGYIPLDEEKNGFFDLPPMKYCNHPNHNPPQHLFIPMGRGYRHKCPKCGNVTVLIPPQISF